MRYLPLFKNVRGRPCLVVGGGPVAQRKIQMLLRARAAVPQKYRLARNIKLRHAASSGACGTVPVSRIPLW